MRARGVGATIGAGPKRDPAVMLTSPPGPPLLAVLPLIVALVAIVKS